MTVYIIVSLYSTRLILASLGGEDFGIFNVIGGSIAMLGFLNSTLANATQRFMSYAEGEGIEINKRIVFNVSLGLHVIIALLTLILFLSFMPLLFNKILNIEPSRIESAKIVYYCFIFSTILTIINVPYDAVLNAHENMLYYSIIGILEAFLRLGIALLLTIVQENKLILYGILMGLLPLLTLSIMKIYCHRHYSECTISFKKYWKKDMVKKIASFSGWNFLTAISSLVTVQGIGLVLNHFFGAILNTAQGIANQVNGALSSLASNLMKALNPVLVKGTVNVNQKYLQMITFTGAKFSTLLILVFAVPLILDIDYVLKIWLKQVPEWCAIFCILQLILAIILQTASSAATIVYGYGKIKHYAIWKSTMNFLPIVLVYLSFWLGGNPYWLYIPMIAVMGVGGNMVIIFYSGKYCGLSYKPYFKMVLGPILYVGIVMVLFGSITYLMENNFIRLIACFILTSIGMILACATFGLNSVEKIKMKNLVNGLKDRFI